MSKVIDDVEFLGVNHRDRKLFDELIPLPWGTSYNSYLIRGKEKNVLIDTADPIKKEEFLKKLDKTGISRLDYIVSNHAEQDHSGLIPDVLKRFPEAMVLTTPKGKGMLMDLSLVTPERVRTVEHEETISLGGKTLQFFHFPWVHWPETMVTYYPEAKILFSCDFFGSHYGFNSIMIEDDDEVFEAARLYYAQIMMPFAKHIRKHLQYLRGKEIRYIAPSHGPVYKKPERIISLYENWSSEKSGNRIVLVYVSMHGSTKGMVEKVLEYAHEEGIEISSVNIIETPLDVLVSTLVDTGILLVASPIVLGGLHPAMAHLLYLVNMLKPNIKLVGVFGSMGWGGNLERVVNSFLTSIKPEFLKSVMVKGMPGEEDEQALRNLVKDLKARISA